MTKKTLTLSDIIVTMTIPQGGVELKGAPSDDLNKLTEPLIHTPAPWVVEKFSSGDVYVGCDPIKGRGPSIVDSRTFICKINHEKKRGIDAKANAQLIAAAPELLEALEAMVDMVRMDGFGSYQALDMADEAIKKARGEL